MENFSAPEALAQFISCQDELHCAPLLSHLRYASTPGWRGCARTSLSIARGPGLGRSCFALGRFMSFLGFCFCFAFVLCARRRHTDVRLTSTVMTHEYRYSTGNVRVRPSWPHSDQTEHIPPRAIDRDVSDARELVLLVIVNDHGIGTSRCCTWGRFRPWRTFHAHPVPPVR